MYHQQRRCSHLGLEYAHRPSTLSLPPNVRDQIYEEADTIRDCDLDLVDIESWDCETDFRDTFSLL